MTTWTRITPGTEDAGGLVIAHWNSPRWLTLRAGLQRHGDLLVDKRGGSIAISRAELANIPPPPEQTEDDAE